MDYDETEVLTRYVWRHCTDLMSEVERRSYRTAMMGLKAAHAEERGNSAMSRILKERAGDEGDPEIRAALADGFEAFRQRVTRRLLSDPGVQERINRCPACGRVVRTPLARQCLWCHHNRRGADVSPSGNPD